MDVVITSKTWHFNLSGVVGINFQRGKLKWYKFNKNPYYIKLFVLYDEHDESDSATYMYTYNSKKDRDVVMDKFKFDMSFEDLFNKNKINKDSIIFDFQP